MCRVRVCEWVCVRRTNKVNFIWSSGQLLPLQLTSSLLTSSSSLSLSHSGSAMPCFIYIFSSFFFGGCAMPIVCNTINRFNMLPLPTPIAAFQRPDNSKKFKYFPSFCMRNRSDQSNEFASVCEKQVIYVFVLPQTTILAVELLCIDIGRLLSLSLDHIRDTRHTI